MLWQRWCYFASLDVELPPNSKLPEIAMDILVITNRIFELTIMPKYERISYEPTQDTHALTNDYFSISVTFLIEVRKSY